MRRCFLLLVTCLGFSLSAAVAQHRPGPAYYLRYPAPAPHLASQRLLPGPVPASPAVAPLPAVAGAPEPTAPRYDLTSLLNFPLHVPPGLPEPQRMAAPPAASAGPGLPLPRRGALDR